MEEIYIKRFWSRVDKSGDCWIWTGGRNWANYGRLFIKSKEYLTHRLSYMLATNTMLNKADCIYHRCDNPPCVNPAHLFKGTRIDNVRDMVKKGHQRYVTRKGDQSNFAKLSWKQVSRIRKLYAAGNISQSQLARCFGITQVGIWKIVRNKSWISQ